MVVAAGARTLDLRVLLSQDCSVIESIPSQMGEIGSTADANEDEGNFSDPLTSFMAAVDELAQPHGDRLIFLTSPTTMVGRLS